MADSIPAWQGCSAGWGFSACGLCQKSTKWKKVGNISKKKKLFQPNLKHPSNQIHNVSFPLHLFNLSSPFGLQRCSNRKSCFEIKKIKKGILCSGKKR